ncbi:DUF222 domain-containing protein [Plantibacter sp. Mn2098]|uniref:HNH endonuclease n=1 Tax=Plantibacter sp. Mn2098 TaxID=3395266 RepID=UPI003BE2E218
MDIPSNADQVAELITSLGDQIVVEQRGIAAAEARIASLFAQAAQVADLTAQTVIPAGTSPGRARELARLSLQAELSAATRVPERTIVQRISEAEVLVGQLPCTLAALAAGEISAGHARVIVDQVGDVAAADRAAFEARVLPLARVQTAAQLRQAARRLREKMHPRTIVARHLAARQERHVTLTPAVDGMSWLSILTTAPIASAAFGRLEALTADARAACDGRTRGQLMTDHAQNLLLFGCTDGSGALRGEVARVQAQVHALVQKNMQKPEQALSVCASAGQPSTSTLDFDEMPVWGATSSRTADRALKGSGGGDHTDGSDPATGVATSGPAAGQHPVTLPEIEEITRRIVPTVHITVPVLTLLGHGDQPGSLEGYGPIDPETAARLTANAKSFTRILTHPETGAVLSVGRDRYKPPPDLKRALMIRDTHCRAPGCTRPARRCDLDHTIAWSAGGETSVENLAHLCPKHHHLKHDTTWTLKHDSGGVLHWISPSGRQFTTEPDPPDWCPLEPRPGGAVHREPHWDDDSDGSAIAV